MPRIDLQVPYEEKELIKSLGALWDIEQRVWFIPDDIDYMPFLKWIKQSNPIERLETAIICLTEMLKTFVEQDSQKMRTLGARIEALEQAIQKKT